MISRGYELMQVINIYPEQNTMVLAAVDEKPKAVSVLGTGCLVVGQFVWYKRSGDDVLIEVAHFVNSKEEFRG